MTIFKKISILSGIFFLVGLILMFYTDVNSSYQEVRKGFWTDLSMLLFTGGIYLMVLNSLFKIIQIENFSLLNALWDGPKGFENISLVLLLFGVVFGGIFWLTLIFDIIGISRPDTISGWSFLMYIGSGLGGEIFAILLGYRCNTNLKMRRSVQ